jgi:hypothetical protein
MSTIETEVRKQQLKLLRFEKFLKSVAPVALATGLSAATIAEAQAQVVALSDAKIIFDELDATGAVGAVFDDAQRITMTQLGNLAEGTAPEARRETLASIVAAVDAAHVEAEKTSLYHHIRLIGQRLSGVFKTQGGTPKEDPPNKVWFQALIG